MKVWETSCGWSMFPPSPVSMSFGWWPKEKEGEYKMDGCVLVDPDFIRKRCASILVFSALFFSHTFTQCCSTDHIDIMLHHNSLMHSTCHLSRFKCFHKWWNLGLSLMQQRPHQQVWWRWWGWLYKTKVGSRQCQVSEELSKLCPGPGGEKRKCLDCFLIQINSND